MAQRSDLDEVCQPLVASLLLIVPSPLGMVEVVLPLQYLSTAKLAELMHAVGSVDGQR